MKYAGIIDPKNYKKVALCAVAALVALLLLVVVVQVARSALSGSSLLATLPPPAEDAPLIVVETAKEEFPLQALKLFAESSTISVGGTPLGALLPVFAVAEQSALVVTERETGIAFYGVVQLDRREQKALEAGKLPDKGVESLAAPQ